MKLTKNELINFSAKINAKRTAEMISTAKESGLEKSNLPIAMMLINVRTTKKIAEKLNLGDEPIDVTEERFDAAVSEIASEVDDKQEDAQRRFIETMQTIMFGAELSTGLFRKESEDETEKADS